MKQDETGRGPGWNRPPSRRFGVFPTTQFTRGPEGINVELRDFHAHLDEIFNQIQASWGDEPEDVASSEMSEEDIMSFVERFVSTGSFQMNTLEHVILRFAISGVSRVCTHQIVRSRIGASFAQQSGRNNDARDWGFGVPETICRALEDETVRKKVYRRFKNRGGTCTGEGYHLVTEKVNEMKALYAALVDSGVPYQDARHVMPLGLQTFIHANYTWPAFRGFIANRAEHNDAEWEIDCVAQLMRREVCLYCAPMWGKALFTRSDAGKVNLGAAQCFWPPNGKYPLPKDMPTDRRPQVEPEQSPFFVLDPRCNFDRSLEVNWIPTKGTWPSKEYNLLLKEIPNWKEKKEQYPWL